MSKTHWLGLLMILSGTIFAQEKTLEPVSIQGIRPERFMSGQKNHYIDSVTFHQNSHQNLGEFLLSQTPIIVKNYGAGQLASVSFRGTSASHTAVLWNGININYPSLGQADFSTIPMVGFDDLSVQFGSGSSTVGTDAVGGSIMLRSLPDFQGSGTRVKLGLRGESTNNLQAHLTLKHHLHTKKGLQFYSKTTPYWNKWNHDLGEGPIVRENQSLNVEPIRTLQGGVIQDLFLLMPNKDSWSLNFWYNDHDLTIQPQVAQLRETTAAKALRTVLSYHRKQTLARMAYISDRTQYGKGPSPIPSESKVKRLITRLEQDLNFNKTSLKIGAEATYIDAVLDGSIHKNEWRSDFYALFRQDWTTFWNSTVNFRQALVSGYNPPFTPSIGNELYIFKTKDHSLLWNTSIARSYRVPTLNERYWDVLGNPDIKPENGWNKETGLKWKTPFSIEVGATYFHNRIKDWTYWNPTKNYRVENLQEVLAKGWEIEMAYIYNNKEFQSKVRMHYSWLHTSQQKEYGPYTKDLIGKQLVYIPRHSLGGNFWAKYKSWSLDVQPQYQSRRYITFDHSGKFFDPYFLLNARLGYSGQIRKCYYQMALQSNNLTDTLYPNVKQNAMPLRTWALQLTIGNI
ncbi:TonB-dependent receptor [Leadbetterella byssophila DSM 17132]|uniref:TonB-dependent receptor n=1 Tax=Leadbetterella byssophila (strain DSM 17132 / JCM 16389 / KACC 11308 / NBRC 106382 / 4M15) TaxID=649349 RepID=E4RXL6_LEAB4|nr:TonB-dependent receptor [Leadbetterella byssophila]ADQ17251.1 TonB-dependent receptor [Leadbetterella byssophila DSM 17132]